MDLTLNAPDPARYPTKKVTIDLTDAYNYLTGDDGTTAFIAVTFAPILSLDPTLSAELSRLQDSDERDGEAFVDLVYRRSVVNWGTNIQHNGGEMPSTLEAFLALANVSIPGVAEAMSDVVRGIMKASQDYAQAAADREAQALKN